MEKIELFAEQIDKASDDKNTRLLIIGDANLDANKWEWSSFVNQDIATCLKASLDRNGIRYEYIGNTYHADHAQANGNIILIFYMYHLSTFLI